MPRMVVPGAALCVAACLALLTQQSQAQGTPGLRIGSGQAPHADVAAGAGAVMRFDIPPQPLQNALDAFNAATGFSGLYGAAEVANRYSAAVQGIFSADAALHKLVEQSGLSSYFTAADAYVLEPDVAGLASALTQQQETGGDYDALLQAGVRSAFCRNALIAPGDYRIALSFRVAANGRVEQARLLDTTGNKARDTEILKTLRAVRLAHGPARPAEPFVMLILPHTLARVADCGAPQ